MTCQQSLPFGTSWGRTKDEVRPSPAAPIHLAPADAHGWAPLCGADIGPANAYSVPASAPDDRVCKVCLRLAGHTVDRT
jgi:hypothetical protein